MDRGDKNRHKKYTSESEREINNNNKKSALCHEFYKSVKINKIKTIHWRSASPSLIDDDDIHSIMNYWFFVVVVFYINFIVLLLCQYI